jgi:hypothetical protein
MIAAREVVDADAKIVRVVAGCRGMVMRTVVLMTVMILVQDERVQHVLDSLYSGRWIAVFIHEVEVAFTERAGTGVVFVYDVLHHVFVDFVTHAVPVLESADDLACRAKHI